MKLIIAGSRPPKQTRESIEGLRRWYAQHRGVVAEAIADSHFAGIEEIVSGKAKGFDVLGEAWAAENHVPVKVFPANWNEHGKRAGAIRNLQMAKYADALIALSYGTPGTRNMIATMKALKKPTFVMDLRCTLQRTEDPTRPLRIRQDAPRNPARELDGLTMGRPRREHAGGSHQA